MAKAKFTPDKKGVIKGTKKKDKIVFNKSWKKAITVNALGGNDTIDFKKSKTKNNKLNGGDGNDIIYGGSNVDIIKGDKGNDKLYGNAGNDQIWGGAGNDLIEGGAGNDKLIGDAGNDTIRAGAGNDIVDGGVGNDFIYGQAGFNTLRGGAGADKIWGGTQNDTIFAGVDNDYVDGGSGHDIIYGEAGHDTLLGGAGNDTIYGGIGNDTINAGAGVNTIFFNRNEGTDTVVNGGGNDKIVFAKENNLSALTGTLDGTNLTLSANGTTVKLQNFVAGNHSAKELKAGNMTFNLTKLNGLANGNLIFGTDEAEEINASGNGNDIIIGGNGLDTITFHNFDQDNIVILGNDGIADTIKLADAPNLNVGGSIDGEVDGNDVILRYNYIEGFRDSIRIKDFILNDFAYDMTIKAGDETSKNIKEIVTNYINNYDTQAPVINGTKFKDNITTKEGVRETVYAGDGNDYIDDRSGVSGDGEGGDTVYGGKGNDHIFYNHSTDEVYLDGGEGNDTIEIYKGTAIGGLGDDEIRIYSNAVVYGDLTLEEDAEQTQGGDDFIIGNSSKKDDTIYGGGGNDSIVGNGGNDYLHGGAGDDTIYTGSSSGASDSTENIVTHAYGDAGDDIIYGQTVKNIMEGGKGNDSITGWSDGEDIFVYKKGDGADTIFGGNNGDTVDTIKFTDETIDEILDLTASFDGNDLVISYNPQNGNDKIVITDYFTAGAINSSIDTIELYNGDTYSLKTDVENRIDATTAETTGTVLSDLIIASDEFSNTIHGGLGNDKIISGTQNDTLYGDAGANIYEFNSGSGIDTVYTTSGQDILKFSVSLQSLSAVINGDDIEITNTYNSDKVILKDYMNNMVNVTIKDNSGFSTTLFEKAGMEVGEGAIEGTAGVDRLIGGAGSDTITGHADNDILNGRGGSDIYVFNKGDGNDVVINGTDGVVDYLNFADSTKEELEYDKSGNDLVIRYNGGSDSVTVKNYFDEGNTVTKLMDSTCASTEDAFDISEVNRHTVVGVPPVVTGTILNDVMTFTSGDDYSLSGGLGNDTITIGAGTNTVDAGKGNDSIVMGTGSATLIFRNGDGHDTITMNALAETDSYLKFMDCEACNLNYELSGDDMILGYNYDSGTGEFKDSVTIKDWATYYDPSTDTIPVLNKIKDSSGYSGSQDNILYRFTNYIDNFYTQASEINGTKFNDDINPKNGVKEVIYGGYGNDSIFAQTSMNDYITGDGEGADTVYGGEGNDHIYYNSRDNVYLDGGAGNDTIKISQGIAIGGLGEDLIRRDGFWSDDAVTIYGDLTCEEDAEQTQGGADTIFMLASGKNEIVYGGGGNDTIKGRGGNDTLYGGAGDDWIWSNSGYAVDNVEKDSTAGWVSEIHGGAGADYLFAQVETNTLYGDEGNDNFYAYSDQHTTLYDSSGTDTLNMFNTEPGDASKDALNIIFNVSKTYDYDPENHETLFNGDVMLLSDDNLALYCNGEAYAGVTIKGNAIERINDSGTNYITNTDISSLADAVAGWLTSANGGAGYDNVTLALASEERGDLLTFIADNTVWN